MQLGAIIAGADVADQQLIYEFGLKLGLSFQLKDDYLDAFGDEKKVGKKIGGDILQNKKTYIFIQALARANPQQKKELDIFMNETNPEQKIAGIKGLFESTGARHQALDKADELYHEALNSLQKISAKHEARKTLAELAGKVNNRDF